MWQMKISFLNGRHIVEGEYFIPERVLELQNRMGGLRQFVVSAVRDESLLPLRKTKISALVANAIEWGKKQVSILLQMHWGQSCKL